MYCAVQVQVWKTSQSLATDIYFHNDNSIVVNQYVASVLNWNEKGFTLTQASDVTKSDTATFTVSTSASQSLDIYLRIPEWISGPAYIAVNNETIADADIDNGYVKLSRSMGKR